MTPDAESIFDLEDSYHVGVITMVVLGIAGAGLVYQYDLVPAGSSLFWDVIAKPAIGPSVLGGVAWLYFGHREMPKAQRGVVVTIVCLDPARCILRLDALRLDSWGSPLADLRLSVIARGARAESARDPVCQFLCQFPLTNRNIRREES